MQRLQKTITHESKSGPHLSGKIFQDGGQVNGGTSAHAGGELASLDKPSNPAHGELQSRLGAPRNGLLTNSPPSRHFRLITRTPHCKHQHKYHNHRKWEPSQNSTCKTRTKLNRIRYKAPKPWRNGSSGTQSGWRGWIPDSTGCKSPIDLRKTKRDLNARASWMQIQRCCFVLYSRVRALLVGQWDAGHTDRASVPSDRPDWRMRCPLKFESLNLTPKEGLRVSEYNTFLALGWKNVSSESSIHSLFHPIIPYNLCKPFSNLKNCVKTRCICAWE